MSEPDYPPPIKTMHDRPDQMLLTRADQAVTCALRLDTVLAVILEQVGRHLGTGTASVWLIDVERDELVCRQTAGSGRESLSDRRTPIGTGILGWAVRHGAGLVVADARQDERCSAAAGNHIESETRSVLCAPLQVGDKKIGVLQVVDAEPNRFGTTELTWIESLAAVGAVAIEAACRYQDTEQLRVFNERIVQGVSEGILIHNPPGFITFANPKLADMLGYAPEELIGQHWTSIVPAEYVELVEQETAKRPRGITSRYDAALLARDGQRCPVLVSARPYFENATLAGVLCVFTDITDRVRAEQALRDSEANYRTTLNSMADWIHVVDTDLRFLLFNESLRRIGTQLGLENLIVGRTVLEGFPFLPAKVLDEYQQVIATGKTLVTQEMIQVGDREFITAARKIPVFEGDKVTRIVTVIRDITEAKRVEEALRQAAIVVENSPTVLFRCKAEQGWPIEFVSQNVDQYGYTVDELVGGHVPFSSLISHQDRARVVDELIEFLKRGENRLLQAYYIHPKKGETRWVEVRTAVERDEMGQPTHLQGVVVDVTEQRELQRQLEQQARLAAVGQLAAGIAHDFNNILASVTLYADMLLRAPDLPRHHQKRISTIRQQSNRAADLIQQILDFSRKAILEPRELDLLLYFQDMMPLLARTLPESIRLELKHEQQAYVVRVDPTRLQQVIMNLAVNARDAMPAGGDLVFHLSQLDLGQEDVAPFRGMQPRRWICLRAIDTGIGIPPENLPHVFEPFFTTKEVGKGTGLGLAQVYGIIKQHGGHIGVTSQLGQGSQFAVYLPSVSPVAETSSPVEPESPTQGWQEMILVVEDDPMTRTAYADILSMLNYQVLTAIDGRQALAIFDEHKDEVSLVLSDWIVPKMGGLRFFEELKRLRPDVKILVLTGYAADRERDLVSAAGLTGWLSKPVNLEQLADAVKQALEG